MNAVLNDAHVMAWLAWLEEQSLWHDTTLDACTYWGQEGIKASEAAMLLCGMHPEETTEDAAKLSGQSENFRKLLRVFKDVAEHHSESRTLQGWQLVAKDKGLSCDPWIDGYAKLKVMQAPPPEKPTAPVVVVIAASGDEPWKEKARARAYEIIKRDGAKDLYPSQVDIADEIAGQFRQDGLKGTDGKPLTGAYIKRHALKGISSAQSKLISTAICWGK